MTPRFAIAATALLLLLLPATDAWPCSIFAADDGSLVFASNNEDFQQGDYDTAIWYVPPQHGRFGYAVVGYSTWEGQATFSAQGGVNDQGLFLDGNAAPYLEAQTNPDGRRGTGWDLFTAPLESCSTVQEALDVYATFNLSGVIERAKIFIADRFGDAAIFEGDWTTHKTGSFLVSTNFYESIPDLGGYPCWRHDAITQMLTSGPPLSLDLVVAAAEAASHGGTYYTNIHDLQNNTFRLYYRHDFTRYVTIDLDAELATSGGLVLMADLFGPTVTGEQGEIALHPDAHRLPSQIAVILRDAGLNLSPAARDQAQVMVTSESGDEETLALTEILPHHGVFVGSLPAYADPVAAADGVLQAAANDQIVATYHDEDDGSGNPADVQAEATIVCDLDQDGYDDHACGGPDCEDLLADFSPGATEFCDGQDDDCDLQDDEDCTACGSAQEPDFTTTLLDPNPISCGTCVEGDFDEAHHSDDGPYRQWADAYEFEAVAGQRMAISVYRPHPHGILVQALYDDTDELVATDAAYGSFVHTFDRDGTYTLALVMMRVDPTVTTNAYRLELHCLPEPDPGADAGPDGGEADAGGAGSSANPAEPEDTSSGCGCGTTTGRPSIELLLLLLACSYVLRRGPNEAARSE